MSALPLRLQDIASFSFYDRVLLTALLTAATVIACLVWLWTGFSHFLWFSFVKRKTNQRSAESLWIVLCANA
jgi:hypothetical protein